MEIITSHMNTDLDGLASMVAAQKLYPRAVMVFPGKLSRTVEEFMSLHKDAVVVRTYKDIEPEKVKKIILVDTKNVRRLGKLAELLKRPGVEIHIYDHHPWTDGDVRGSVEVVEPVGATVTLLVEMILRRGEKVSSLEATVLTLGIYEDTGSLLFTTTTPRDVAAVAKLLEYGANLGVVADFLGRPMSDEQKALLKDLLMSVEYRQVKGIKILLAQTTVDEFVDGLSLLTHTISEIERSDVVFVVVEMEDRVHIVARSNLPQVDVSEIVAVFGGGGHPSASSAAVKGRNPSRVMKELWEIIKEKVRPPLTVGNIMSSPVKTVPPDATIEDAGQVMLRYGHSGLLVVENNKLVGVISRRDVEKAARHGLGHAPVKGYMTWDVVRVDPEVTVNDVREIMVEHDIGRVPVVDNGNLVGIVSRTDVLRTLHSEIHTRYHTALKGAVSEAVDGSRNIGELVRRGLSPTVWSVLRQAGEIAANLGFRVYAAGGIVRDILFGAGSEDVDLVVEGDGIKLAKSMAAARGVNVRTHPKFGTAEILFPDLKVDVATARVEFYEYPAALPKVESSSLHQDLYRRDFTINAMAVALNEDSFGELVDYFGGREDLQRGLIRILYNLSFIEDPTRILRAIKFERRYYMQIEPFTLEMLEEAVRQGVLSRVSNERVWYELKRILSEPRAGAMLARIDELGVWPYLFPGVNYWEVQPVLQDLRRSIEMLKEWGFSLPTEKWLVFLIGVLHWTDGDTALELCNRYHLSKRQTDKVLISLSKWREVLSKVWKTPEAGSLIDLANLLYALPREAYPLLLSLLDEDWLKQRFNRLLVTINARRPRIAGKDIKEMGYRPGPVYRRALDEVWKARLSGRLDTIEEEKEFVRRYIEQIKEEV